MISMITTYYQTVIKKNSSSNQLKRSNTPRLEASKQGEQVISALLSISWIISQHLYNHTLFHHETGSPAVLRLEAIRELMHKQPRKQHYKARRLKCLINIGVQCTT